MERGYCCQRHPPGRLGPTNGYALRRELRTNFFATGSIVVRHGNVVNIQDIPVLTTGGALVITYYDFFVAAA